MTGIIFNPTARGNQALRFREHLSGLGPEIRMAPTQGPGHGRPLASELVRSGCTTVVAAGGDGTVNEVLNGICDVEDGLDRARLGVLPLGTVNVVAKELGIPTSLSGAWAVIQAGRERRLDLPCATVTRADGGTERRHFVLMAGAGLSAQAIARVNWNLKVRMGPLAYVWAGFQAMRAERTEIEVQSEAGIHRAHWVEVGNGEYFGGRFPLFPGARPDDGELDVTLAPRIGWPVLFRVFFRLLTHRLGGSSDVIRFRTRRVTLRSARSIPLHLEGDLVGVLPATVTIEPGALRMVVP